MKLHLTISCCVTYFGCHMALEIWITILKIRDVLEVKSINGWIILKGILKK